MWGAGDHPFHGQRLNAQKIFPNLFTFIPIGQPKHVAMEKKNVFAGTPLWEVQG